MALPVFEALLYALDGGVATVTLKRPERLNTFTALMRDELVAAFDAADADDAVRAVIVTGAGRAFCAGQDLADPAIAPDLTPGATQKACSNSPMEACESPSHGKTHTV